jgi:hypothetical protein
MLKASQKKKNTARWDWLRIYKAGRQHDESSLIVVIYASATSVSAKSTHFSNEPSSFLVLTLSCILNLRSLRHVQHYYPRSFSSPECQEPGAEASQQNSNYLWGAGEGHRQA